MEPVVVTTLGGPANASARTIASARVGARTHALAAAFAFALLCASCSQKNAQELADAGNLALGRSDWGTAIESFEAAAAAAEPGSDAFIACKLGECEAWCGVDGERAATAFLELASQQGERVGQREYVFLIGKLSAARSYGAATRVLDAGLKRFPTDAKLDELGKSLAQAAANAGNEAATKDLRGLGYIGDK